MDARLFLEHNALPGERVARLGLCAGNVAPLPTAGGNLCWHCCHPFDTPPLPLPVHFDALQDVFYVTGRFCSWSCVKAYNLGRNTYKKDINCLTISHFALRYHARVVRIPPAPPRERLRAFGGDLTIEQFRDGLPTAEAPSPYGRRAKATAACAGGADVPALDRGAVTPDERPSQTQSQSQPTPRRKETPARRKAKDVASAARPADTAMLKLKRVKASDEPDLLCTLMGLTITPAGDPGAGDPGVRPGQ